MYKRKALFVDFDRDHTWRNIYRMSMKYGGDAAAIEYQQDGEIKSISYTQNDRYVAGAALRFAQRLGDAPGFVGLQVANSPAWPMLFWGLLRSGHDVLLLDARATPQQTEHLLAQAGVGALVTASDAPVPPGVERLRPEAFAFADGDPAACRCPWADRVALCTSGTTATSRVYVYDGHAIISQALSLRRVFDKGGVLGRPGVVEKSLAFLPLHHIFGLVVAFVLNQMQGGTVVFPPDMTPERVLEACRKHCVTCFVCVPLFWNSIATTVLKRARLQGDAALQALQQGIDTSLRLQRHLPRPLAMRLLAPRLGKYQDMLLGRAMHTMISGGGHVLPESLRLLNGLGYRLVNGYGSTEAGIFGAATEAGVARRLQGHIGEGFLPATGKIQPTGGDPNLGELLICGEYMHAGRMEDGRYIPRDRTNPWFATGDLVRLADGRFYIEGRIKEVIVNESGENVYPDELEDAFLDLPGVKSYTATGLASGVYEDIALVLECETAPDAAQLAALAAELRRRNATLPLYKQVRRVLLSQRALPLANGIKVKRQQVRKGIEDNTWPCAELNLRDGSVLGAAAPASAPDAALAPIQREVRAMFARVLALRESDIEDDAHFIYDLGGDSLTSLSLLAEAEKRYQILIRQEEYLACTSVGDLSRLILSKTKGGVAAPAAPFAAQTALREEPVQPIIRFEDAPEYRAFLHRTDSLNPLMEVLGNPYFVAHDSVIRDTSMMNGREVINFGSYNYLGLSGHPETVEAAVDAVRKYGTSASGSRLLAGEKTLHKELERAIAAWKHTEAALVLVGGHSTNVTFVGNFCGPKDLILYDALSHNSVAQGCRLSQSPSRAFPHNDVEALENILRQCRNQYEKVLLAVEGVYSMDGDIAPIPAYVRLKKQYGLFLMVDEAHSSCVLGAHGGGVDEYFDLAPGDIDVKMGTLSKGLGTCGGYLAGSFPLIEYLRYNVPGFVFSVGMSPPLAAATLKAVEIIRRDNSLVQRLHHNIHTFLTEAMRRGLDTCLAQEQSPVAPIRIGEDEMAFRLSMLMQRQGVFVPPAVYPAVPKGQARLRYCLVANHTDEQIIRALDLLAEHLAREKRADEAVSVWRTPGEDAWSQRVEATV
ncbi:MAG: aminotransferase class I/II-fold pyridoxal phosphate-dependent enzyme [Oscillospiraceae bacterium]|jgi:8-amino-7-oxononanoate synthase/acyl carrier protein|nr:aminotransferase class I/II-fold pyridoxal phosphate-dependent enzyme [Oscillospiraceae bacterium]